MKPDDAKSAPIPDPADQPTPEPAVNTERAGDAFDIEREEGIPIIDATPRDWGTLVQGSVRRADKAMARLTGSQPHDADEIEEVAELMTPAVESYGGRIPAIGWLVVAVLALASLLTSHVRPIARRRPIAATPATADKSNSPETPPDVVPNDQRAPRGPSNE